MIGMQGKQAVKVTHIPTGISVTVDTQRTQRGNHDAAMRIIKVRLWATEKRLYEQTVKKCIATYDVPDSEPWPFDLHDYRTNT